jgi:hypothetical protein
MAPYSDCLIVSYEIAPWKQDHLASLVSSGGARYKNEESASARLSQWMRPRWKICNEALEWNTTVNSQMDSVGDGNWEWARNKRCLLMVATINKTNRWQLQKLEGERSITNRMTRIWLPCAVFGTWDETDCRGGALKSMWLEYPWITMVRAVRAWAGQWNTCAWEYNHHAVLRCSSWYVT